MAGRSMDHQLSAEKPKELRNLPTEVQKTFDRYSQQPGAITASSPSKVFSDSPGTKSQDQVTREAPHAKSDASGVSSPKRSHNTPPTIVAPAIAIVPPSPQY